MFRAEKSVKCTGLVTSGEMVKVDHVSAAFLIHPSIFNHIADAVQGKTRQSFCRTLVLLHKTTYSYKTKGDVRHKVGDSLYVLHPSHSTLPFTYYGQFRDANQSTLLLAFLVFEPGEETGVPRGNTQIMWTCKLNWMCEAEISLHHLDSISLEMI